jgi:proton-dependent oligopeptide transporter, POT family
MKNNTFFGHPRGLSTLFFTEMWERFSYYGLRPLLVLFMAAAMADGGFGFDRTTASSIVGIYAASVYLASLPGGWIADRLWGLRKSILIGAVLITLGHFAIALSSFFAPAVFFIGLVLIVLGTGLLKPNISAIVGELYPEGGARRDGGFTIFYMGINIGAFFGQLVTGILGEKIGWHYGFGAAGIGMLFGLLWFYYRGPVTLANVGDRIQHISQQEERRVKLGLWTFLLLLAGVIFLATVGLVEIKANELARNMSYIMAALAVSYFFYVFVFGKLNLEEKKRVGVILVLFLFSMIFWAAFEQAPTSLNLFAADFTDRYIFGWEMPALWFQSFNSFFIIALAPLFAAMWTTLSNRGLSLSSPFKFSLALGFAAIGFAIMIFAANNVVEGGGLIKVSAMWLIASYFFQTVGELFLSPVGLSSMTKLAPKKFAGQMMGVWFLATAMGNLIAGIVGGRVDPKNLDQMPQLFTQTTLSLGLAALVLLILVRPIQKMMNGDH